MAERADYSERNSYYYNRAYSYDLILLDYEMSSQTGYSWWGGQSIFWHDFVQELTERKIKIYKNPDYEKDSTEKDIRYTFNKYVKEKSGFFEEEDSIDEEKLLEELNKNFENEKKYYLWKHPEDNKLEAEIYRAKSKYMNNLRWWAPFSKLVKERKIKILEKPEEVGWFFTKKNTLFENIIYTFEKYYSSAIALEEYYKEFNKEKSFKKSHPQIIEIYKNFVVENDEQFDNLLNDLIKEKNLPENEVYDILVREVRRKYDFENNRNNENIEKYYSLSQDMKEKTKAESKRLNEFRKKLAPFVKEYDPKYKVPDEKENLKKANEELKKLNDKVIDASSRYAFNVGKLKVVELKLKNFKQLEKRRNDLQDKLRKKNLEIEERQQILKEKTELNEKLKNIEKLEDQVSDLKSRIPDKNIFEQEKILREKELRKLKNLNNASIREKNALLRSIEFKKMKEEIRVREQERYEQEQREKEELKQAKIIFLKEKKIAERRIDELKSITKARNSEIIELKKKEQELLSQKEHFKMLKNINDPFLREKKMKIEEQKIKTLELQKQTLENKTYIAEQQKLFADSIQKDIDNLNAQKNILQNLQKENEKILRNTKDEIEKRQQEIEKTIKLNLENLKQREANILSEESKIKLDVFYTLENVKEQTEKKLDLEKKLQDLKDEIIRKQDVSDLLNETVEKISNKEILDGEEYIAFLEKEIAFKQKLEKKNLTLAEYKEIALEEKEDLIERLEKTKSQKLKKIYQLREEAIEQQMRIILTEGADNLKNNLFSLKYEIENLEKEKEISERKEDLAKFQSDNFKRELKLRKQEIELLKTIRIKALENERKINRNEARSAISDIIKSIEKTEEDEALKEKLDELLDYTENKEIDRKSKATLFSLIDKIEDKEIHDAAKEKLDFILGKIELHDNIDESKKALDQILDKIEDATIRKDVEEKIDEILDDVELEDYDFLDEDNDFDSFLANVRKHISGEKKMEQFSKIDTILEEVNEADSKLKMDENIEMKDFKRPEEEGEGSGETSFDEFNDYNFFIQNIEDPILREKTRTFLGNVDGFEKEEEKIPKIKNAYKSAINSALWEDQLDSDYWKGNIILDENAKFLYEQKVNNVNTALVDYNIHIDPKDMRVREFLDIKLTNSLTEKKGEINGYIYNGEKIISRNISRNFFFNYIKKPAACQRFIDDLKEKINKTARSQIASESFFEGDKAVQDCAIEYIGELREEQSYQIDVARNSSEMRSALRDANDMEKEIKKIKKNLPFKMRLKIFKRTLSWRITKLLRLLWKHKGKTAAVVFTILSAAIGILLNQLGVVAVVHNLKKAAKSVKQYADDVHTMGRKIIQNVQSLYRVPGTIIGYTMIILAVFLRVLYFATRLGGTYSSAAIFGALGLTFEALIYFEGSADKINEKVADAMEETGNIIEDFGIRAEKRIVKQIPKWYWDKPTEEKSILEIIESGSAKMVLSIARGTQKAGKKVEQAGEAVRSTIWYLKIFIFIAAIFLTIIFVRNYIL